MPDHSFAAYLLQRGCSDPVVVKDCPAAPKKDEGGRAANKNHFSFTDFGSRSDYPVEAGGFHKPVGQGAEPAKHRCIRTSRGSKGK